MSPSVKIEFVALGSLSGVAQPSDAKKAAAKAKPPGTLVIFTNADFGFGAATRDLIGAAGEALVRKAAAAAKFKGKPSTALDILAPAGLSADRLLVVGVGPQDAAAPKPETANGEAPAAIKPVAPLTPADYARSWRLRHRQAWPGCDRDGRLRSAAIAGGRRRRQRRIRARRATARLSLRSLQDQKEGRRRRERAKRDHARRRRSRRCAERGEAARRRRRGRPHRALARQ